MFQPTNVVEFVQTWNACLGLALAGLALLLIFVIVRLGKISKRLGDIEKK